MTIVPPGFSSAANSLRTNTLRDGPNDRGRFGDYGGRFVAETLMPLVLEVERAYNAAKADPAFDADLKHHLKHYVGRPSPLWFAERLTKHLGGAKVYFKRDELNHTGSHKDARYFIDLSRRWTVWPHARFNIQNSVSFWKRAYTANGEHDLPALRTGDRELSSLFTAGGGGGVRIALGKSGSFDDLVLTTTIDAFYTSFADAIYVKQRLSALAATALEIAF